MSVQDNGGPAFPVDWETFNRSNGHPAGMTLRDYFAAKALQAIVTDAEHWANLTPESIAAAAYRQADAMLKARQA